MASRTGRMEFLSSELVVLESVIFLLYGGLETKIFQIWDFGIMG